MWNRSFWAQAFERAVKTFAQAFSASLVVATGLHDVDWKVSLSGSLLATLLSFLSSFGSAKATGGSPDLTQH